MEIPRPICLNCKWFTPDTENGLFYCKAFPNPEQRTSEDMQQRVNSGIMLDPKGIPDEVLLGENPHTEPIAGQVGEYVFTPLPK